jgi:glycerophosphoryl diester phosphodiesterase
MPTIDEVLATVPQGKRLFIELKAAPDAVPLLVDAINASGKPPPQFVVVSFAAEAIARVKRALPQHTAFWISDFKQDQQTGTWSPTVEQLIDTANRIHADGISVRAKEPVDPTFVRMVKNAGLKLHVWTIDSPDLARRMIEYGVDGITTNRAAWMREQLLSAPAGP